ncbi:hypothetical protein GCM10007907_36980 [Chitinimonas prasina]|uniref:Nuclear transport factor 2 family protein n=1 Tax=Chitinimonas prasina TaxID=1434937 RepID=A0ABQ5YKE2_9NEIS|nr:hypothetical protein [Chitinimonas prasina]GLR14908.1 hypothetical protein GCM10007907_36980 [Chitinimonas prasina]
MKPTLKYLNTPAMVRSRHEMASDALRVVVENINDKSEIYLSEDGGETYRQIGWKQSKFGAIVTWLRYRDWPPHGVISIEEVEPNLVVIYTDYSRGFCETDYLTAIYSYDKRIWKLKW